MGIASQVQNGARRANTLACCQAAAARPTPISRTDVTNLPGNERSRERAASPLVQSTAEAVRERRLWISNPLVLRSQDAAAELELSCDLSP